MVQYPCIAIVVYDTESPGPQETGAINARIEGPWVYSEPKIKQIDRETAQRSLRYFVI